MSDRVNENRIIGETRLQPIQKVLNVVAEYINHTRFAEGESQITSNNREVTVSFKEGMLVKDILKLLSENDVNTDISDYGRRLSDLGYLLSKKKVVGSEKAQEFARSIYEVGQAIIPEKKRGKSIEVVDTFSKRITNYPMIVKSIEDHYSYGQEEREIIKYQRMQMMQIKESYKEKIYYGSIRIDGRSNRSNNGWDTYLYIA
jgi:hypothetical protein